MYMFTSLWSRDYDHNVFLPRSPDDDGDEDEDDANKLHVRTSQRHDALSFVLFDQRFSIRPPDADFLI